MKRILDLISSFFGLLVISPILLPVIALVWLQDYKTPFYIAPRVGKDGKEFNMVKLRSMIISLDKSDPVSTGLNDKRVTSIGHFIRKFKLDELCQLWNVLVGDMSLVGPRPQVEAEGTEFYTEVEKKLLSIKPGITDFSSIVFSDEGVILKDQDDVGVAYNQLIRPWKSRLGLVYIENQSLALDLQLILWTFLGILSKENALKWVSKKLMELGADENIVIISRRHKDLYPFPPPGSDQIFSES